MIDEIDNADDFGFQLLGSTEDVRIVLCKSANAQHAVQHAGALIAIDSSQLGKTQRQIAIAAQLGVENHDMSGAVHRLHPVGQAVDVHRRIHVFSVALQVAADFIQHFTGDVRSEDKLISAAPVFVAPEIFNGGAYGGKVGMPENQTGADFLVHREK